MKTVTVKFNVSDDFATGKAAQSWSPRSYNYIVTDAQAQAIIDKKIEFAVVAAPTGAGALKVVKIVDAPGDNTLGTATRPIICLVDLAEYEEAQARQEAVKRIRAKIEKRAKEVAEEARLAALASGDPAIAALLEELKKLQS